VANQSVVTLVNIKATVNHTNGNYSENNNFSPVGQNTKHKPL
jgi:hypothetical protein